MIKFVNAKINLGLNVVRKRADGYHDLETIFFPVGIESGAPGSVGSLCDILEITPSDTGYDEFLFAGNQIDCPPEKNLIYKALHLFKEESAKRGFETPAMKVYLEKHLPDGAGMGGGSADASFTLMTMNEISGNHFNISDLAEMALKLGADCPFFIYNKPMYAEGVGERLTEIDLTLKDKYIAIVKPQVSISTKEAFGNITPKQPECGIKGIISRPISEWRELLVNDFEAAMFKLHPEIKAIKEQLYANGAVYASMTGSGSAFYGIFDTLDDAQTAVVETNCPFSTVIKI